MARKHVFFLSLALAAALVAGVFAALRTTELGASAATPAVSDAQIAAHDGRLDRFAKQIDRQARKRPPQLPALRSASASGSSATAPAVFATSSGPSPTSGSSDDDFDADEDYEDHGEDYDDDHGTDDHDGELGDDHGDRSGSGGGYEDERSDD